MKYRFPILAKIAVIGTLTSVLVVGISLWFTSIVDRNREKQNLITNIDNTLDSIKHTYTESADASTYGADVTLIRETILGIYERNKDVNLNNYASFDEYFQVFQNDDFGYWVYPKPGVIGYSYAQAQFRNAYTKLSSLLETAYYSSDATAVYAAFNLNGETEEDKPILVFVADSRYTLKPESPFFHVAGSHYQLKEGDIVVINDEGNYDGRYLNGYLTRTYTYLDQEDPDVPGLTFFVEYDFNAVDASVHQIILNELLVLLITLAVMILAIILSSYFMISSSIRKLSKAANFISSNLENGQEFEVIDVKVKTHDEIKTLSDSFVKMEKAIASYTSTIKKNAEEKERNNAELNIASQIQLESLPSPSYFDTNTRIECFIRTAKEVGGDFYDYFYVGDELVVLIADVSGKGVPAALFMMKSKDLIKSLLNEGLDLISAINKANEELSDNNKENLFVTAFIGIINFAKGEIRYVNAGHEKPYIISNGEIIKLDGVSNFVLGGLKDIEYISEKHAFKDGDTLFLFTDGLNESINPNEEEFGYERIEKCLLESKNKPLADRIQYIVSSLEDFEQGKDAFDDLTMLFITPNKPSLHLSFKKKDYSIIEEATDKFIQAFPDINEETISQAGIVIDEILNNLITYEKRDDLEIDIDFSLNGDLLLILFSSNGNDYDIIKNHKRKYINKGDEEIAGGFGINLVKQFSKDISYQYIDHHSYIKIILENK